VKRNFRLDHPSILNVAGKHIDLHNAYDLAAFGTDLDGGQASLVFSRNGHALDKNGLPSMVKLTCSGNVRIAFNDLCAVAAPINHEGIEIAYFDAECDWWSFLDEGIAQRQEPQGIYICFNNGFAIRIACDETTASTS